MIKTEKPLWYDKLPALRTFFHDKYDSHFHNSKNKMQKSREFQTFERKFFFCNIWGHFSIRLWNIVNVEHKFLRSDFIRQSCQDLPFEILDFLLNEWTVTISVCWLYLYFTWTCILVTSYGCNLHSCEVIWLQFIVL